MVFALFGSNFRKRTNESKVITRLSSLAIKVCEKLKLLLILATII